MDVDVIVSTASNLDKMRYSGQERFFRTNIPQDRSLGAQCMSAVVFGGLRSQT